MTNTLATFTPAVIQGVANENGWDTKEYDNGWSRAFKVQGATVHVHFDRRFGVQSAWLALHNERTEWFMLDGKVSGKRDIVMRWLAKDFSAGNQYALQ